MVTIKIDPRTVDGYAILSTKTHYKRVDEKPRNAGVIAAKPVLMKSSLYLFLRSKN